MIRWGAYRPAVVWALAVGLVLAGVVSFIKLPLATSGVVEIPRLTISAQWAGAAPELIETYVTSPIEAAVQGVRGIKKTASESRSGTSSINIELAPDTDVPMARLAILERLETLRSGLPTEAQRTVRVSNFVPQDLQDQPLLVIKIVGSYTPGALKKIVEDRVKPRLSALEGISSVDTRGGAENGIAVTYDPVRMRQLGIDPAILTNTINEARKIEAVGEKKNGMSAINVAVRDVPHSLDDVARLPVRGPGGKVFSLGELTTIHPEEDSRGNFYRLNGVTAVTLVLQRDAGADAIKTSAAARALLPDISKTLPTGVRLEVTRDTSEDLHKELNDLMLRGAIAFGAVLLVLLIALKSLQGGLLVVATALISICGTALSLYLLNIPANMLTLAGLAMGIGILVQNGLVVVERLRAVPDTADARADAGHRISPAVIGATMTTTVVLLPFLYLQGNARAAFTPFAAAFALALFWSVGTSLVFVPAVGRGGNGAYKGWPRLARLYQRLTMRVLRWRYATMVFCVLAVAVLTWGFIKKVPKNSWGNWGNGERRTTVSASVSFPKGSDPDQVQYIMNELEAVAVGRPGVSLVEAVGRPTGGQLTVEFTKEAGTGEMPWIISDELTQRAVLIGGAEAVTVRPPEGQGFYGGSGGGSSINHRVKILGYSYEGVRQFALDLQRRLSLIPRVRDPNINAGSGWRSEKVTSVALQPDRQALGRIDATAQMYAASVAREVRSPSTSQTLTLGDEEMPISVRSIGTRERDLKQLGEGMVSNPSRAPVRIADVSTISEVEELGIIQRENQQYVRVLAYDFRGPQKLSDRTHKAFMASINIPAGYTVADDQGYYRDDESSKGLWTVFALGVVLVLIAVALVFDSLWAAGMVFLSLPMALGGVVAAFWITKTAFTREAAVGVILVVGLAVNHAILQIDAAVHSRKRRGGRATAPDIFHAATDRVTMIVLVTLTTLASLIPMAVGTDADSLFGAIALATAGGTIAGTFGVMFLLPPMLLGFKRGHGRKREKKKKNKKGSEAPPAVVTAEPEPA